MRFAVVVLFAASLASAGSLLKRWNDDEYEYPACANTCIEQTEFWPCNVDDPACICLHKEFYINIATCIDSACSPEETNAAAETFEKYCKDAGVDIHNPVPTCGAHCYEVAPTGDCATDDDTCLCTSHTYIETVDQCFKESCLGEDLETAQHVGEAWCRSAGVDISPVDDHDY